MFLHCRGLMRDNFAIDYYGLGDGRNVLFVLVYLGQEEGLDNFKKLSVIFLNRKVNSDIGPTYNLLFISINNFSCKVRIFCFLFNYVLFLCFLLKNIKFFD